jgi:hypothetical protein
MTTYAEYLKRGNKVNPKLLAPKEAKLPSHMRPKVIRQKPPLDATNRRNFKGTVIVLPGYKG